jgi:large subunit ribosomal protein L1|tara:strand:+ start:176 stop:862 length:687 start_codon:yes stop_codon:yes gene_type:complete
MNKRLKKIIDENDFTKKFNIDEAVDLAINTATTKFDETIDICMNLNIDSKNGEQNVRGTITLPKGLGKKVKVCVFAKEDKQQEAKDAGADIVGGDELIEKVEDGFTDFDRCISTPDMMSKVGKLGKVLGPRSLMPNPKLGSVTNDLKKAIEDAKAGEIEYKNSDTLVQAGIGKSSFDKEEIKKNIIFFVEKVSKDKPSGIKGDFIKRLFISPTMGPGINIDLGSINNS